MTDHKDFKRHVRERMEKTGESYTAARRHFVAAATAPLSGPDAKPDIIESPPPPPQARPPSRLGMKLDAQVLWRFFDSRDAGAPDLLRLCQDFVSSFESPAVLLRACAAIMAGPIQALTTDGFRLSKGERDVLRLFGPRRKSTDVPEAPPGSEHASLWVRDGSPARFVSQPYELPMEALRDMIRYCDRNELTFTVHGSSWHFPGSAVFVEFRRKDGDPKIQGPRF